MAITVFRPAIWSANILTNLRNELVYAGPGIVNRDYEGVISQAGDTVHIVSFADPAVRAYTKNTNITYDLLTDTDRTLVVNQSDYFAFTVDDIDKRQALPGFVSAATKGAAYNLVAAVDTYVSTALLTAVNGTGNDVGPITVTADTVATQFYKLGLLALRTKLNRAKVPMQGRWVVVPPELYAYLLQDNRFVANAQGGVGDMAAGFVGRIAGFDVYESNTCPVSGAAYHVIAGHKMATTFADSISETEALRLELQFGDAIRGLHLYGAKVTLPGALALATVTLT